MKVILADDEPVIINGLKKMINWEDFEMDVIGEAYDGKEAWMLLLRHKPEIIICDICMPEMTGIDLIKKINEEKLKTKVIFISGYQDFFYAQEAIRHGAMEYLLKPVKKTSLEQVLKKVQMIIWEQNPLQLMKEPKNEIQEIFSSINENEEYADHELYERFDRMGLDYSDKMFVGVCFCLTDKIKKQLEVNFYEKYELIRFSVYNKIQEYYQNKRIGFVIKRDDTSCNLMVLLNPNEIEFFVKLYIEPVLEMLEKDYQVEMFVGIGEFVESVQKLLLSYKAAKFTFELKYFEDKSLISYRDVKKEYNKSFDDYNRIFDKIAQKIIAGGKDVEKDLITCLDIIESIHYGNRYAALNRCFAFSVNLFKMLMEYKLLDDSFREDLDGFMDRMRTISTYKEVKSEFLQYYINLINRIYSDVGNKDKLEVAKIKDYIKLHYSENITLAHMAKLFYMNSFYFSSFFKKEIGQNFKDYLTDIRMKEAIKLILTTDKKTYEIGEAVGYNNVRQFTDKFKDLYGTSPAEYKKAKIAE